MVYILAISCGFTVSHIYCPKGERWIIGSDMPPINHGDQDDKHHQKRNIDTFNLKFEFESLTSTPSAAHQIVCIQLTSRSAIKLLVIPEFINDELLSFINKAPPDIILKPDLHKIQALLI